MTVIDVLNHYVCTNALLIVAAIMVGLIKRSHPLALGLSHESRLWVANAIFLAAVLLPVIAQLSRQEFSSSVAQVWAASSMETISVATPGSAVVEASGVGGLTVPLIAVLQYWWAVLMLGGLIPLWSVSKEVRTIRKIIAGSQRCRVQGRLRILSSDEITVPFSLWVPFRSYIVVPSSLLLQPALLRVALRHEAQHHRQIDTKWLYLYLGAKIAFFWNPAVHLLERWLRELQELACDEAVIARGDIGREAYCCCLLQMAEASVPGSRTALSAGMVGNANPKLFQQRVIAALHAPEPRDSFWKIGSSVAVAVGVMAVAAVAASSTVQDRRVSLELAEEMVKGIGQDGAIPVVVNDAVLEQLNALLATPDGRAFLHSGLQRMGEYQSLIARELESSELPRELLAVPLIESGYQNLPPRKNPKHAAGIWMFIGHTARQFGLKVDGERDDRLDVAAQTKAAMRLLGDLHAQFGDWGLAFLGYNMGSARVEKAIAEVGSRDPWEVIASGAQNDPQYLPRLMAAILIIKDTDRATQNAQ